MLLVLAGLDGEEAVVEEEQVVGRGAGGEEDACEVLGAAVEGHAEEVAGPLQVGLVGELRASAEDDVVALGGAALEHEQAELVFLGEDGLGGCGHEALVVGRSGVEVHVHAHGCGGRVGAAQLAVGGGQARVVHLHQAALGGLAALSGQSEVGQLG